MKRFGLISLSGLLLAVTGYTATAQEPTADAVQPQVVNLTFAWKPGLAAQVTSTKIRTQDAEQRSERSATTTYGLRVAADGDNLRIQFTDPKLKMGGDLSALPKAMQTQLVAQVASLMPDFVVTQGGDFVKVHNLPTVQKNLQALLSQALTGGDDTGGGGQLLDLVGSEAVLTARAAGEWNGIVGTWRGAELELGQEYLLSNKEPIPAFPGQEVQMNYAYSARQVVPCERGGVKRECIELEIKSVADPEDMKRLVRDLMSMVSQEELSTKPIFQRLEILNLTTVITEPEGLVPHHYVQTRTLRATIVAEGKKQDMGQVDTTEVQYTYSEAAAAP